jgi:hypothetical protein
MTTRSKTSTIAAALRVLAQDDDSECGTVGAALYEAAERLEEYQKLLRLVDRLLMSLPINVLSGSTAQRIASAVQQFAKE